MKESMYREFHTLQDDPNGEVATQSPPQTEGAEVESGPEGVE